MTQSPYTGVRFDRMETLLTAFAYLTIFALLAALAWRDLLEYILPNEMNAALAISCMALHIAGRWQWISPVDAVIGALVGGGFLLTVGLLADRFYKKDSLGMGDVKLMAAAGLGLGFPNIMLAMSIGAFVGVLHGGLIAYLRKLKGEKDVVFSEINVPAGLGLAVGIAIVMLHQYGFDPFR